MMNKNMRLTAAQQNKNKTLVENTTIVTVVIVL